MQAATEKQDLRALLLKNALDIRRYSKYKTPSARR